MPNLKSAEKRVRQIAKRQLRNKGVKSAIRTQVKKFLQAITEGNMETVKKLLPTTISSLDKSVAKGIHHRNYIARKKSALYAKYNALVSIQKSEKK